MVSYDTPQVATEKVEYIKHVGLGGAMWWESSGDRGGKAALAEDGSLIGTFVQALGGPAALGHGQNCLEYPNSKYDNLKAGMPEE